MSEFLGVDHAGIGVEKDEKKELYHLGASLKDLGKKCRTGRVCFFQTQ